LEQQKKAEEYASLQTEKMKKEKRKELKREMELNELIRKAKEKINTNKNNDEFDYNEQKYRLNCLIFEREKIQKKRKQYESVYSYEESFPTLMLDLLEENGKNEKEKFAFEKTKNLSKPSLLGNYSSSLDVGKSSDVNLSSRQYLSSSSSNLFPVKDNNIDSIFSSNFDFRINTIPGIGTLVSDAKKIINRAKPNSLLPEGFFY
jgi:hypothetical protein